MTKRYIYASTLEAAAKLHRQREEEIAAQAERDRQKELSALVRLLDLSGNYGTPKTDPTRRKA